MQHLLRQVFHDKSHGRFRAEGDATEAFALAVDAILVELDLDEVVNTVDGIDGVGNVRLGRPPGQVADVELITALMLRTRRGRDRRRRRGHGRGGSDGAFLVLVVVIVLLKDVVVKVVGLLLQLLLRKLFDVGVKVDVDVSASGSAGSARFAHFDRDKVRSCRLKELEAKLKRLSSASRFARENSNPKRKIFKLICAHVGMRKLSHLEPLV